MKKIFLACLLLTVMLIRIYPQSVTKESFFSDLDTTKLSTGILYNLFYNKDLYARFDGLNDTVCSTSEKWMTLYRELSYASLRSTAMPPPMDLFDTISSKIELLKVPVGLINRKCDSIKSYAFTNDLLRYDTVRLYDGDNTSESPYLNLRCFSGSVLTDTVYSNNVQFLFSDQFNFIEPNEDIDYLKVDFGDGNGLITISENEEKIVSYSGYGLKNIIIEEHTTNGIYKCMTKLMIQSPPVGLRSAPTDNTSIIVPITALYPNNSNKGSFKVWYGANNDGPAFVKPIILVEGFDPNNENGFDKIWDIGNNKGLLDELRLLGFDIVILNFNDASIKIESNAMVLEALIQHINMTKASNEELVIIGASMGGLVARYALAHMESQNVKHHTRLFASIDTPHKGAYFPISTQYLLNQLRKSCNSSPQLHFLLLSKIEKEYKLLTCDAAKQMLVYHCQSSSLLGNEYILKPHQLHTDLFGVGSGSFKSLTSTGFPQNCKNIALSCGSGNSTPQAGHDNNSNTPYVFVMEKLADRAIISLKMAPLTSVCNSPNTIFYIDAHFGQRIYNQFMYSFNDHNLIDYRVNAACGYEPYDGAPGGNYTLVKDLCKALKSSIGLDVYFNGSDCFIPTKSALFLQGGLYDDIHNEITYNQYEYEVDSYGPHSYGTLVFDAFYVGALNRLHVTGSESITEQMRDWLISQITSEGLFFQNKTISEASKRYEAYKTIFAGNNVTTGQVGNVVIQNNSDIKFVAGEMIKLGPGFEVKLGSKFKAEVKH